MTSPQHAEPTFLRRDIHGRAIYMPFGTRALAYLIPEAEVPTVDRRLGYLTIGSVIPLIVVGQRYFPSSPLSGIVLALAIIAALALTLWHWVPRGLERVTLSADDLPPVDLSPGARARRVGKPLLWLQFLAWAGLTILCLALVPARPVFLGALALLFGLLTWDSARCLRAAYATPAQ